MLYTIGYFKQITTYPRPSKDEDKIRDFLIKFFSSNWYKYIVDNVGNLVVYIPAKNSNSKETIILQSHLDMVCVKNPDSKHDFFVDPIEFYEKDGFICAKNTTLGADNGIWVALSMSAIHFDKHPSLELVFTIDEEAWMSWIMWLDYELLKWTKIINLDSEEEDMICISSAWWIGIISKKKLDFIEWKFSKYDVEIFGMKWWHSWVEIDKNRWNAIKIFFDFLTNYEDDIEIYKLNSWIAPNVIPNKISATLWISDIGFFEDSLKRYLNKLKNIFDCPELSFNITENNEKLLCVNKWIEIIRILQEIKDWIYTMSQKIDWLVQTSINLWISKIENWYIENTYLLRSSDNTELQELKNNVEQILTNKGFNLEFDRWYPGWQDDPNSHLLSVAKNEFEKVIWKKPQIVAIHAWLECWVLVSGLNNKKVNAISIWPNIYNVHSTEEKVEIESVERIEKILAWILENI